MLPSHAGEKSGIGFSDFDNSSPMSYQDVGKIYKENGAVRGTILEMLNLLGMGTASYGK